MLELIGCAAGGRSREVHHRLRRLPVTTEQWLTWNRLAMDRHAEDVIETMTRILEQERIDASRRRWRRCGLGRRGCVLSTLDRMGML